jgi:hypothetical protein
MMSEREVVIRFNKDVRNDEVSLRRIQRIVEFHKTCEDPSGCDMCIILNEMVLSLLALSETKEREERWIKRMKALEGVLEMIHNKSKGVSGVQET